MSGPHPALVALRYGALSLIAALLLLPIYWLIMSSFRPAGDIFRFAGTFGIDTLVPRRLTLENYEQIFAGPFPRSLFNSLRCLRHGGARVIVNSMAGFAFAVFDFPFKKPLFIAVLLSFMMPFESIVIPLYTLMRTLNWTDTYAALILPRWPAG